MSTPSRAPYHREWRRRQSEPVIGPGRTLRIRRPGRAPKLTLAQYVRLRALAALPDDERPKQWELAEQFGVSPACLSWALVRGIKSYDALLGTPPERWKSPVRGNVVDYWREVLSRAVDEARAQP